MGRLIDESELISIIQGSEELLDFQKDECINCIKACDTAYDPDKVVEQLKEFQGEMEQFGCDGILTDMIEIVKGGGVDGN
jgi:hypothetical protein